MTLQDQADAIIHRAARSIEHPYAVVAYEQDDFQGGSFTIYTIHGGSSDRSSVSAATLRRMGIEVPR